jgi:hypothetical protein
MTITPKIKKQITEIVRIINYGIDWQSGEGDNYDLGCVEGACFVASCMIVQDILVPNGINNGLETGDLIKVLGINTDIKNFPLKVDMIKSLTEMLELG